MKFTTVPTALVASILLAAPQVSAKAHQHHRRLDHIFDRARPEVLSFFELDSSAGAKRAEKRGGKCQFPTDDSNMVAVTPESKNAGWAMSPDQECKPGNYCPFACKPGMVMNQWEPDSTYSYPSSMNGGLYCNDDGEIEKPFKGQANCVAGTGSVEAVNKCGSKVSFCQTVLPGNEAMLIPTLVSGTATIAVPDSSYWCSTAAHFYINPPGTGEEGCIWGDESKPVGNWSPYVAGANTESNGQTFVKLGWNPIWEDSALKGTLPEFGVEIKCPDGGCNGLPCKIDPADGEGKVTSNESADGAGGAAFCVVTVPKGVTAQIVVFSSGGSSSSSDSSSDYKAESVSKEATTTSSAKATSSTPKPTSTKESSTSTTEAATTTTEEDESTTTSASSSKAETTSFSKKVSTTDEYDVPTSTKLSVGPGIFHENGTTTPTASSSGDDAQATGGSGSGSGSSESAATTSSKEGDAIRHQGSAFASLVVAFVAAACFF